MVMDRRFVLGLSAADIVSVETEYLWGSADRSGRYAGKHSCRWNNVGDVPDKHVRRGLCKFRYSWTFSRWPGNRRDPEARFLWGFARGAGVTPNVLAARVLLPLCSSLCECAWLHALVWLVPVDAVVSW